MSLPHDDWVATAIGNVGYVLAGKYRVWNPGTPVEIVLDAVVSACEWFRPYMSLGTIADVYKHEWAAANPGTPYALVVIALLNGDGALVEKRLAAAKAILCARDDEVCDQFREFALRVRQRLSG
jgi:hypothetical protein